MESKTRASQHFKSIVLTFPQIGSVTFGKGYEKRVFDMTDFRLKLGALTPIYCITETSKPLDESLVNELKGRPRPSIVIGNKSKFFDRLKNALVIFLDPDRLSSLSAENEVRTLVLQSAREQLSLSTLSPYETFSAVYGDQFFGRRAEIAKIRTEPHRNFVLYGARRMGKTSLLKHLQHLYDSEIFSVDPKSENYGRAYFISCLGIKTLNDLQEVLLSYIDSSEYWAKGLSKLIRKGKQRSKDIAELSAFRALSGRFGRTILLLLDEIDVLLDSTEKDIVLGFLCKLSDVGYRIIMAGYKSVWREAQNQPSPLWNFAHPLYIAQFNKDDSLTLIKNPMLSMGIELDDSVVARIYSETGGIPNYMQHYCSVIVSEFMKTEDKITDDVFDAIHSHPNFDTVVMNAFHENVRESLGKFVSYYAASINRQDFTINELIKFARTKDIKHLDYVHLRSSLDYLVTMGFLQTVGETTYRFVAPIILYQLRARDLEFNLDNVIRELKAGIK